MLSFALEHPGVRSPGWPQVPPKSYPIPPILSLQPLALASSMLQWPRHKIFGLLFLSVKIKCHRQTNLWLPFLGVRRTEYQDHNNLWQIFSKCHKRVLRPQQYLADSVQLHICVVKRELATACQICELSDSTECAHTNAVSHVTFPLLKI